MPLVQYPCLQNAYILRLSWPSWTTIVTRSSEMLTTLPLHYLKIVDWADKIQISLLILGRGALSTEMVCINVTCQPSKQRRETTTEASIHLCLQKWYLSLSLANLQRVVLSDMKQRQKLWGTNANGHWPVVWFWSKPAYSHQKSWWWWFVGARFSLTTEDGIWSKFRLASYY